MDKQTPQQTLVEVTLAKPHEHGGTRYTAGDTIKVTAPERDWLLEQQIIKAAPKETK